MTKLFLAFFLKLLFALRAAAIRGDLGLVLILLLSSKVATICESGEDLVTSEQREKKAVQVIAHGRSRSDRAARACACQVHGIMSENSPQD